MPGLDWSPVAARLCWAEHHTERVRRLSADWAATAFGTAITLDAARNVRVYRAEAIGAPPAEIALALGDVLHQTARRRLSRRVVLYACAVVLSWK
jgi:hypothetical protein